MKKSVEYKNVVHEAYANTFRLSAAERTSDNFKRELDRLVHCKVLLNYDFIFQIGDAKLIGIYLKELDDIDKKWYYYIEEEE